MTLNISPNLDSPDEFYQALIDSHGDLTTEQSHAMNARLVLLLANQIGSLDILREALAAARGSAGASSTATQNPPSQP